MTIIITVFNQAGGVGKTSLTLNLGYTLATRKNRVLLVDLDPQASLTTFMGVDPTELEVTLYDTLVKDHPISIQKDLHQLDLAATNINLSTAEMELISAFNREQRLATALEPILESYDFILVDSPPSLGILSVLGLTTATHLLVPIETEFKSYFGTGPLIDTIAKVRRHLNPQLSIAGFVPMKFDKRRSQHTRTYEQMKAELTVLAPVFPPIPDSTVFPDATEERLPLALYKPKHPAVTVLKKIAKEIEKL